MVPRSADQRVVVSAVHNPDPSVDGILGPLTSDCERVFRSDMTRLVGRLEPREIERNPVLDLAQ